MYATTQFSFEQGEDLSNLPAEIPARKKKAVPKFNHAAAATVLQLELNFDSPLVVDVPPRSFYEYLIETNSLRKLVDICLWKAKVPDNLREDAISYMYEAWFRTPVKEGNEHGQICNYAHKIGMTVSLQMRRDLSAVLRLPRDTFTKKQGKAATEFMEMSGGAAFNPLDIDEHKDDVEFAAEPEFEERYASAGELAHRLSVLPLNPLQKEIARLACVEGLTAEEIAESEIVVAGKLRKLDANRVRRVLKDITEELYAYDDAAMQ